MIAASKRASVHRRVVLLALVVSAVAVLVVLIGTTLFDLQQFRSRVRGEAASLAGIIAENSVAALAFDDSAAAHQTLDNARMQSNVVRACIYSQEGGLFAGYARTSDRTCASDVVPEPEQGNVAATRSIQRAGNLLGYAYVEGDLSGLAARAGLHTLAGLVMLLIAGGLAYVIAQRLTRAISRPIASLARAARRIGHDGDYSMPEMPATDDEVGDLVNSFQAMVARVREANAGLLKEIEQRKAIEAEREILLERERETSRMKDEFVATVSHELRTPLGAILGWTQVMQATHLDRAALAKALEGITRSAEAQARVIEDLVDVSRISTGKLKLSLEVVDLRIPVAGAVDLARREAEAVGLTLETHFSQEPIYAKADPDRLRQVVANLLSNSIKFTEPGGCISVTVRASGLTCDVIVSDDGVGIDGEVLPHIFDRYRQADSSTTRRFEGLGLGLSIVKEVAELHGGTVTAASEGVGKGATFRVRLPRYAAVAPSVPGPTMPAAQERLDGVHVLAVDDNPDALDIMATALRAVGADVRTASSGKEAISAWEDEPPDVLLCDLAMPVMDGFDVLARIRERDARAARYTPAIAVTAHATAEHRRRSSAAGFVAHVTKPYRLTELVHVVKEALD